MRLRLKIPKVTRPMTIPASIDSSGNPGIPPPLTLEIVVVVAVFVVSDVNVEATNVVNRLVDVVTVETNVVVAVPVNSPPKGENRSIVARGGVGRGLILAITVLLKSGGDPTIHPMLGEIM